MTLQIGDRNETVTSVQAVLNLIAGIWRRPDFNVGTEDGVFGSKTQTGVVNYQAAAGLPVTGIVDDATLTAFSFTIDAFGKDFQEINWSTNPTPTQRNDNYTSPTTVAAHSTKIKQIAINPYLPAAIGGIDWKMIGIIAAIALGLVFMNMGDKKR